MYVFKHRVNRFVAIGAVCFFVQWLIVHGLLFLMATFVADGIGFLVSAQLNLVLSRRFTWADTYHAPSWSAKIRNWAEYNGVVILAALVNAAVFTVLVHPLGQVLALLGATLISTSFSFLINHFVVFRPKVQEDTLTQTGAYQPESVAVFLPAFNEAENLPIIVSQLDALLQPYGQSYAIIIVDDGSMDATGTVADQLATIFDHIRVVHHPQNRGYGATLRTGLEAGLETGSQWIGFLDADGQFESADFIKLIQSAQQTESEIAIGYRIVRADSFKRRLMGRSWHLISSFILGFKAKDVDCGMKVFRRDALAELMPLLQGEYATISPEILALATQRKHRIVEVGVSHFERQYGEQTGANLKVVIGSFKDLFEIRRSLRLIRIAQH